MKCPNCKRELNEQEPICPHCGTPLGPVKPLKQTNNKVSSTNKGVKSKLNKEDQSSLVGGTVAKDSFIKLSKKKTPKKEIVRKDYVSYIDYREAKEQANQDEQEKVSNNSKSLLSSPELEENMQKVNASSRAKNVKTLKGKKDISSDVKSESSNKVVKPKIYDKEDMMEVNIKNSKVAEDKISHTRNYDSLVNSYHKTHQNDDKIGFIRVTNVRKEPKVKNRQGLGFFNSLAYMVVIALWLVAISFVFNMNDKNYYFRETKDGIVSPNNNTQIDEEMAKYEGVSRSGQTGGESGEGKTSIVYDNEYLKQFTIGSRTDVNKLISTDSIKQKRNCPSDIIEIENEIIENYGIIAVNLCEMDYDLALELADVIKYIYINYPTARNHLTNITLANITDGSSFIAAFMPIFCFATSDTSTGYPLGIKTQILLNAKYFLNNSKLKNEVDYAARTGYFPANATRSSTVAHEFGHYLSYVALMNSYMSDQLNFIKSSQATVLFSVRDDFDAGRFSYDLLIEAYNEYKLNYSGVSFNEFRASISSYAMAQNGNGDYIYDETVAEAFHDVYLNGNNAKIASKYIMKALKNRL